MLPVPRLRRACALVLVAIATAYPARSAIEVRSGLHQRQPSSRTGRL